MFQIPLTNQKASNIQQTSQHNLPSSSLPSTIQIKFMKRFSKISAIQQSHPETETRTNQLIVTTLTDTIFNNGNDDCGISGE